MTEFTIELPKLVYFRANMETNSFSLCDLQENKWILALLMNGEMTTAKQAALAQRMTACWNACAGMLTQRMGLLEVLSSLSRAMPGKLSSILAQCARRSDEVINMSERIHLDWNADARAAEESVRAKRCERYQKLKHADKVDEAVGA